MEDKHIICILGGTGTVGTAAYKALRNQSYHFRIGVRNKTKAEKEHLYAADNVRLFEIDLDNPNNLKDFCSGTDLVIGSIGPSTRYSEKMLQTSMEAGIPYVDPGGMHLRKKYLDTELDTTAIVGAGLFPGLSGWLLHSGLQEGGEEQLLEIVIGGEYNFTKGSAIDYAEETKSSAVGVPMACVRNGHIVPAERMVPADIPSAISGLMFLPYVTEEIQEILYTQKILNIDAYTAAPARMFTTMTKLRGKDEKIIKYLAEERHGKQRAVIWIRKTCQYGAETIFFEGGNPGDLTGEILAISANAILNRKKRNGVFSMASYLSDYPLLEKLKKIEDFRYEKGRI